MAVYEDNIKPEGYVYNLNLDLLDLFKAYAMIVTVMLLLIGLHQEVFTKGTYINR